jgi:hypothetical protein
MKKVLLLVFSFFYSLSLLTQTYSFADHSGIDESYGLTGLNSKTYCLQKSTTLNKSCWDVFSIVGRDKSGIQTFSVNIGAGAHFNAGVIKVMTDGTILGYCGTTMSGCDYGWELFILTKVDTLGNVMWQQTVNYKINGIESLSGGEYIVLSDYGVSKFNPLGNLLDSNLFYIKKLNSIARYNTHQWVSHTSEGGNQFIVFDSTFIAVSIQPNLVVHEKIEQLQDGGLLGFAPDMLTKYSKSLIIQFETKYTFPGHTFGSFFIRHDSIFVTGHDNANKPYFAILNSSLAPVYVSSSNIENASGRGIHAGWAGVCCVNRQHRKRQQSHFQWLSSDFFDRKPQWKL